MTAPLTPAGRDVWGRDPRPAGLPEPSFEELMRLPGATLDNLGAGVDYDGPRCDECRSPVPDDTALCEECAEQPTAEHWRQAADAVTGHLAEVDRVRAVAEAIAAAEHRGPDVGHSFAARITSSRTVHAEVGVWAGPDPQHRAYCGQLVMRTDEAEAFVTFLGEARR